MTSETPRTRPTDPGPGELAGAIGNRGHRWLAPDTDTAPRPPFTNYATERTYAGEPTAETADGADLGTGGIGFGIGRCDCVVHSRTREDVTEANRSSSGENS